MLSSGRASSAVRATPSNLHSTLGQGSAVSSTASSTGPSFCWMTGMLMEGEGSTSYELLILGETVGNKLMKCSAQGVIYLGV